MNLLFPFKFAKPKKKIAYPHWIISIEPFSYVVNNTKLSTKTLISFILVYSAEQDFKLLNNSIDSIIDQTSPNWELLLVSSKSINKIPSILDERIKSIIVSDEDFFSSANQATNKSAGEFICYIEAGDLLSNFFVSELAQLIADGESKKIICTDEDFLDELDQRCDPFFKPDWNPDYLDSFNYFSKAVAYEKQFLKELGGFNIGVNDPYHDLALRATHQLTDDQIDHINHVMFHFKQRNSNKEEVFRVKYDVPKPTPLVSIIIPTKDQLMLLQDCIDGVLNKTRYKNVEIIIVDNQSELSETLYYFNELKSTYNNIRILHYDKPFNYSDMNNIAVSEARGDVIVFLNNDVSVIEKDGDDWLTEMVSQACRPEIGCVGAKLFYPDGTIQHAGVILGLKGCASHAHKGFEGDSTGYFNRLIAVHNVSAVTAACMAVRKDVFEEVGGFDAVNLKVAYNDVDLCLKVREAGYRNLFTPYAQLIHHESKSRGKKHKRNRKDAKKLRKEAGYLKKKWGDQLFTDPAYNKNLTLLTEDFSLGL